MDAQPHAHGHSVVPHPSSGRALAGRAAVFSHLLIDGDPANNAGNWQWVAGTGTDPRRMRSFNPVRQALRCDPEGTYVRRWVEELRDVPLPLVFRPWRDPELMEAMGYPPPILPLTG